MKSKLSLTDEDQSCLPYRGWHHFQLQQAAGLCLGCDQGWWSSCAGWSKKKEKKDKKESKHGISAKNFGAYLSMDKIKGTNRFHIGWRVRFLWTLIDDSIFLCGIMVFCFWIYCNLHSHILRPLAHYKVGKWQWWNEDSYTYPPDRMPIGHSWYWWGHRPLVLIDLWFCFGKPLGQCKYSNQLVKDWNIFNLFECCKNHCQSLTAMPSFRGLFAILKNGGGPVVAARLKHADKPE